MQCTLSCLYNSHTVGYKSQVSGMQLPLHAIKIIFRNYYEQIDQVMQYNNTSFLHYAV